MDVHESPRVLSGRYELDHLIARGGMAEVYRARDRLLDRPVALKILFPELSVDRSFVERFRREAQAAANLSHPNIVPVFDWGEDGGTYFIVMEYVDGRPLSAILRTAGALHPERAAEIAADVAGALSYAHRHGVIHRDVKPGNVLITDEGTVKVTDFGIARAVNTEESLTQTGAVMGTATYFSPEQAEGLGVDARSDIYSLGVVLYEMVTGRPPFLGETPVAVASKHVREHPPLPRQINPAIPPDLEAVIMKCMAKSPEHRYASGEELRADLLRFRQGRGVAAPNVVQSAATSTMTAVGRTQAMQHVEPFLPEEPQRSRTGLYATLLVLLLIALAVVVVFLGNSLGWWHLTNSNKVTLPTLSGDSLNQAEAALRADGLKYTVTADTSSSQPNTLVLSTDPAAGTTMTKGQRVTLVTGNAGNKISVPNEVNQSVQAATSTLQGEKFQVQVQPSSNCTTLNVVCAQNPTGGTPANQGSTVVLFTAPAPATTTTVPTRDIPDVTGDTPAQACNALGLSGFDCGSSPYAQEPSASVPSGDVVATDPPEGSPEPQGTTVNLIVSSGPQSTTTTTGENAVPSIDGDSEQAADNAITGAGFQPEPSLDC
ncbi:MAG TPA: Stk1 family PASTA domain-containing Ser/Thr kinase, partial [Acidimicrobiales bacterium]|nr:Stk1 family PASTA domain-containing Ser/Thr kinase [Acidimicrobiales bacterium]